jgi:hypothetical protein
VLLLLLQLVLKMEEALAANRGNTSSGSPVAAGDGGASPEGLGSSASSLASSATAAAQLLPWSEHQLPLVELLVLLHWLQQHTVRLQLAPGSSADLYVDPELQVFTAVRVPALAMQSRPSLVGGGIPQQRSGA